MWDKLRGNKGKIIQFQALCRRKLFSSISTESDYEVMTGKPRFDTKFVGRGKNYYQGKSAGYQIAFDIPIDDSSDCNDTPSDNPSRANDTTDLYEIINLAMNNKEAQNDLLQNEGKPGDKKSADYANIEMFKSISESSTRIIEELDEKTCDVGVQAAVSYGKKKTKTSSTQSSRSPPHKARKKGEALKDTKIEKLREEWRAKRHGHLSEGNFCTL